MEAYLLDWANLLLRWTHVIVAIAWIGSSFYFVFLDSSLTKPLDPALQDRGVDGELWAVHGGGFYHPQKYLVAPKSLPEHLHWFFWESYSTWLSGFALFTVLYLFNADSFLIDRRVHEWSAPAAVATALGFLAMFWLVYDQICRRIGERRGTVGGDALVGALVFIYVVVSAWAACQLFAGRAAFLIVGAMMATTMSANVFFWIIPGQRKVIAQMKAGQRVDPLHGQRAKQRSVHNTYFTLPVLVAMLSNHYGWLYEARNSWLVLASLMLAGALIRHSFVARHKALVQGRRVPWEFAIAGTVIIIAVALCLAPPMARASAAQVPVKQAVSLAEVRMVVDARCVMCHNAQVQNKGIRLDTDEALQQHAQQVYQQAVLLKTMPFNNATQITDAERALLGHWYEGSTQK